MEPNLKKDIKFLQKHSAHAKDSVLFARLADRLLDSKQVKKATKICN